ncbi:hypothetical protein GJ744_001983 [Endocarpon pusillum]|uniref:Uncharacterized protein n=1 Tax=Endocarpon pusillum TaxID=364733 RepID=A0A8H7E0B7_9EURO|nr:hypothetical protein GJ744_001983 [Endocarpon pusillum]
MPLTISAKTAPTQLAKLKTKDSLRLLWQESTGSAPETLYEFFPRKVATAFFKSFDKAFLPLKESSVAEQLEPHPTTFVITGGRRDSYRDVLEWALSCCDGGRVRNFQSIALHQFYNYSMAYLAARRLGIDFLETQLMQRLENIARRQVHSEDVELIFSMIEGPHELKDMVCQSIGTAIWERRLRYRGLYEKLRRTEGFEGYEQGVGDVIKGLKAAKKSSPEHTAMIAEKKEQAKRMKWRLEEQEKRKTARDIANQYKVKPSAVTVRGTQGYTISTEGRVVNRSNYPCQRRVAVPHTNRKITSEGFRAPSQDSGLAAPAPTPNLP